VYLGTGSSFNLKLAMEPLRAGQTSEPPRALPLIDGDRWQIADGEHFEISVAAGPHHVRIEKGGYQPYEADVTVAEGGSTPLNVSLRHQH
jgi:hypothetical protein